MKIRSLLFIAAAGLLTMGLQAQAATVRFSPVAITVQDGGSFSLDLVGTGFSRVLDGGGVNISFDPSLVEVTAVAINTDPATGWDPDFSSGGTINNVLGSVDGLYFSSFADRSGSLLFATISLRALSPGSGSLQLVEFPGNPFATGGDVYPDVSLIAGNVEVTGAVPLPAAVWLGLPAFGLLAPWVKRKVSA